MRKFELYYNGYIIGNIEMNNNYFIYTPNKNNIEEIEDESIIFSFLKETLTIPHPFIISRIENMDKFGLKNIKYVNSLYELKEII